MVKSLIKKDNKKDNKRIKVWLLAILSVQISFLFPVVSRILKTVTCRWMMSEGVCWLYQVCMCTSACLWIILSYTSVHTYINTYTPSVHICNVHQWIHICCHAFVLTCSQHLRNVVPVCHWSVSCRWWWRRWCVPLLTRDYSIWKKKEKKLKSPIITMFIFTRFGFQPLKPLYENNIYSINVGLKEGMKFIWQLSKLQCIFEFFYYFFWTCIWITLQAWLSWRWGALRKEAGSISLAPCQTAGQIKL